MKQPAVYLMASQRNGTLYVGVTSNLIQRIWQHKNHVAEGFTAKYHVAQLVWFEQHDSMESAIAREKAIKKWNRDWKLNLIEKSNPDWHDLWPVITGEALDSRLRGNDDSAHAAGPRTVIPEQARPVIPGQAQPVIPAKSGIQKETP